MSSKKVHKEVGLVDSNPNPNTEIRNTVQSRFSDKLQFIDYFQKTIFQFTTQKTINLVTFFAETKSVTKSRVYIQNPQNIPVSSRT